MKRYPVNLGSGIAGLFTRVHDRPSGAGSRRSPDTVRATSLSFRDLMILRGWYPLPVKPDVVPVCDGAGDVVACGSKVTRQRVGDRDRPLRVHAPWQ
jgi:Alcohol dehydrogenase GroES-like domain